MADSFEFPDVYESYLDSSLINDEAVNKQLEEYKKHFINMPISNEDRVGVNKSILEMEDSVDEEMWMDPYMRCETVLCFLLFYSIFLPKS